MQAAELTPIPEQQRVLHQALLELDPCVIFLMIISCLRDLPGVSSPLLAGLVKHSRVRIEIPQPVAPRFNSKGLYP